MHNVKIVIAYDGTKYCGWQTQVSRKYPAEGQTKKKIKTVQAEVEGALYRIFLKKVAVEGSGRTDAGVHALAQVAHFKLDKPFDLVKLQSALNANLPQDIRVLSAQDVALDFHSRFCAKRKTYRYLIANTKQKPLFIHNLAAWIRFPLNVADMRKASRFLLGSHDFKSFQASDYGRRKSTSTIYKIKIYKGRGAGLLPFALGLDWVIVDIEATGFLRNMVRNIVGTLLDVGRGKIKARRVKDVLKMRDRSCAGPCAASCGLYLLDVSY